MKVNLEFDVFGTDTKSDEFGLEINEMKRKTKVSKSEFDNLLEVVLEKEDVKSDNTNFDNIFE